jgi:GGDEF domain-containing protein
VEADELMRRADAAMYEAKRSRSLRLPRLGGKTA